MIASLLVAAAAMTPPTLPAAPRPTFPLPAEHVCELCYHQCEVDRQAICLQLQCVTGWHRQQLAELKCEADRLAAAWYAAWWCTWKQASPQQVDEWTELLQTHIGAEAYWRGALPLPLSWRNGR